MEKAVFAEERLARLEKRNASFFFHKSSQGEPSQNIFLKVCSVIVHLHLNRYPHSLGLPHPK